MTEETRVLGGGTGSRTRRQPEQEGAGGAGPAGKLGLKGGQTAMGYESPAQQPLVETFTTPGQGAGCGVDTLYTDK